MMKKLKKPEWVHRAQYHYANALYLAFYSRSFYVDVVKNWRGFGFVYVLLLTAILSIPFTIRVIADFNVFFTEKVIFPVKSLPAFEIKNGLVYTKAKMPQLVKNKNGDIVAAIDTTGTIKMDEDHKALQILVTKDALIYRFPPPTFFLNKTELPSTEWTIMQEPLTHQMNQIFDPAVWLASTGIEKIKIIFYVMVVFTAFLAFFVLYVLFILVLALMGQFVAQLLMKCRLTYLETTRLFSTAATPATALLFLVFTFNYMIWGLNPLLFILLCIYFSYGVLSVREARQKLVIK